MVKACERSLPVIYYYLSVERMEGLGPFSDVAQLLDECAEDDPTALILFVNDDGVITSVVDYVDFSEDDADE
jgi:hypothetical protein